MPGHQVSDDAVDQQVEVDQPEADRHRQHQHQDASHLGASPIKDPLQTKRRVAQVPGRDGELDRGPHQDADRVGVDLVVAVEQRCHRDQHADDRNVPEERRDREGPEAVVAVQHPDHHPGGPEHHQDREEDLGESDRQALWDLGDEQRHQERGDQDEQGREGGEHQRDEEDQGRGEAERLALVAALQVLGEHGHEGGLDRRVGEQAANQVGHLEGDRECRHRVADPEVVGRDNLADQACNPRQAGGEREQGGRASQSSRAGALRLARHRERLRARLLGRHHVHRSRVQLPPGNAAVKALLDPALIVAARVALGTLHQGVAIMAGRRWRTSVHR